jgi:hypothetical protein
LYLTEDYMGSIKALDKAYEAKWPECYIEIMARAADKPVRTVADETETADLNKEKV